MGVYTGYPTMEKLEQNSKVFKYVIQSAVNNLQGARLVETLLLKKNNSEREDFTSRRSSVVLGFCLHFHYIPTIVSDAHILIPISWF